MSVYGGMVLHNHGKKRWGLRFRSYAAALFMLPQPTPELPSFDTSASLTAPLDDLAAMHEEYTKLVQAALAQAGPLPEIELQTMPLERDQFEALQQRQEQRRREYLEQMKRRE